MTPVQCPAPTLVPEALQLAQELIAYHTIEVWGTWSDDVGLIQSTKELDAPLLEPDTMQLSLVSSALPVDTTHSSKRLFR